MIKKILLLSILFSLLPIHAQSNIKSEAYKKKGFSRHSPLLKPKYPSYDLAETYVLREKAKKGDPFAQHELGIRYIIGIGVPIDTINAAYWIGKAASKNLPAANFNFAIMEHGGYGTEWNPFNAFKNFKVAAESGMEQSQYIIGLMYTDNLIVSKNIPEAIKWLEKSADKGFEESKNVLKEFEKKGLYSSKDSSKSTLGDESDNIEKEMYSSVVVDEYQLDYYSFDDDSLTESEEKEMLNDILFSKKDELKKILKVNKDIELTSKEDTSAIGVINYASNSGSPEALLIKGRLLEYGLGLKTDMIAAASNYLKAFRLGSFKAAESLLKISQRNNFYAALEKKVKSDNADAMYVWAGLIALGLDYSLTEQQAFDLLKKAEKQNHINSIIELGLAYYSGSIVEKDSLKALSYFESAAKLGSSEAKVRLAYVKIQDIEASDKTDYLSTLNFNSKQGSVLAQAALAYCYEKGIAVEMNKGKAANLYRQAAQRGNEAAFNSLRNMYDEIRPSDEEFVIYL